MGSKGIRLFVFFILLFFYPSNASYLRAANTADTQYEEQEEENETVDIRALSDELHLAENGYSYPDFEELYSLICSLKWKEAGKILFDWIMNTLTYEIKSTGFLYREVVCVVIFAAVFTALSSAFPGSAAGGSSFLVSWMILFMLLYSNFRIMSGLFFDTINRLSEILKILIPVYAAAVTVSGNLSTGVAFYEYFMILILFLNWIMLHLFLPGVQYYFILEMFQRFTPRKQLTRLCRTLYLFLYKGMKLTIYLLFGAHLLESMLVPSVDLAKTGLLGKVTGMIPGAGSALQTMAGTVLASGMVIKNTLGVTAILFLMVVLAVPLCKMLIYVLFNLILSILLEPVSGRRLTECISIAGKCGFLMLYGLLMTISLFILVIALTTMVTNRTI